MLRRIVSGIMLTRALFLLGMLVSLSVSEVVAIGEQVGFGGSITNHTLDQSIAASYSSIYSTEWDSLDSNYWEAEGTRPTCVSSNLVFHLPEGGKDYCSKLKTKTTFGYGKFVIRFRMTQSTKNPGYFPRGLLGAFFLYHGPDYTQIHEEIDVEWGFEQEPRNQCHGVVWHDGGNNKEPTDEKIRQLSFHLDDGNYHLCEIVYLPQYIKMSIDGQTIYENRTIQIDPSLHFYTGQVWNPEWLWEKGHIPDEDYYLWVDRTEIYQATIFSPEYDGCGNDDGGEASGFAVVEHWSSSNKFFGSGTAHAVSRSGPVTLYDEGSANAYFFLSNGWEMNDPSGLYNIEYVARFDGFMETYMTSAGLPFDPWDPPVLSYTAYEAVLKLIFIVIDATEFEQVLYKEFVIFEDSTSWWYGLVPFVPMGERMDFDPTIPYIKDYELYLEQGHEYLLTFWVDVRTHVENFLIGGVIAAGDIAGQLDYVQVQPISVYELEVSASAPETVERLDVFPVTANAENVQGGDMHNVVAELHLPSGLSLISGENPQNLGTIPSGGSDTASWSVSADADGSWTLAVEGYCDEGATDINHKTVDVIPPPPTYRIEVIAGVTDKPIVVGQEFDAIAEVENEGEGDVHNVIATLDLPSGLSLVGGSNPQNLGTLAVYDSAWANWVVRADSAGEYKLSVEATCDEGATDVDYEPATIVEPAPLSIDLVSSDRAVENLRFPILAYVTNEGDIWAYNLTATLTLPTGLELVGGDPNPECEEKMYPGEIWTLRWYIKGVAGNYTLSIDVVSEEGSHVSAEKEIEVYPPPSDVYLLWNYTVHTDIRSAATGDIDGDGISDIAFGWRGNVTAIKSDRTLLWEYQTDSDLVMSLDIGDLDGDGKGEVVAGCSDGHVYAVKSPPEGHIGTLMWKEIAYSHNDPYIYDVETGDFDGDGKDDVVSGAGNGYGDVFAFRGFDGYKLWSHALDWSFLPVSYGGKSLGVGDIDGDGKNDVAVAIADFTTPITGIFAYRGYDGLNLWGSEQYGYPTEREIFAVDVGDLNGDGKGEVVAGGAEWVVYALRHTSTGSPPSVFWTRELPSAQIRSIKVGDLDGDGDNDVAVGTTKINGDNVVGLYGSNGDFIWSLPLEIYVRDIDIGDFDGDGTNDVAAGGNYEGNAKIWVIKSPDGSPIGSYTLNYEISWQSLQMGDINDDGSSDVAVGSYDDYLHVLTCYPPDVEGPITSFVVIRPNPTRTNPTANATIVDSLSNIVAAEYFVDVTGTDGTGIPMNSVDGVFDLKSEIVTAIIDISGLSDGNHTIYVHGKDNAGNWGDFNLFTFTIDRVAPNITIVSPQNITYTKKLIDLNVTSDEPIDTWMFSLNGASNFTFTPNAIISSSIGPNELVVYANDTAGNMGSRSVKWTSKLSTPINCSLSASTIYLGEEVSIACSLNCPACDGNITIQYSNNETTWNDLLSGTPLVGIFTGNWTPSTSGMFYIRCIWSGNAFYAGSTSPSQTLNVGAIAIEHVSVPPMPYVSIIPIEFLVASGMDYASATIHLTIEIEGTLAWERNATFDFPAGNTTIKINYTLINDYTYEDGWDTLDLWPPSPYKDGGNITVTIQLIIDNRVLAESTKDSILLPSTRDALWDRIVEIIKDWPGAAAEQKEEMWNDIVKIILLWPTVPEGK